MPFDFFSKKKLQQAAGTRPGVIPPPEGNQDAGLNMAKLAEENAKSKLGQMTGSASVPMTKVAPVAEQKKKVKQ